MTGRSARGEGAGRAAAGRKRAVLFDMGNTLVSYWPDDRWPALLREAIERAGQCLRARGMHVPPPDELAPRIEGERGRSRGGDHRVWPLTGRLARVFDLSEHELSASRAEELCRAFMEPLLACASLYEDTQAVLGELRRRGYRTGIVSNTPWGSPGKLWREELGRLGLRHAVDATVFCTDVGYRKPAPQPFRRIADLLDVAPSQCVFVGDDPRWDLAGPRRLGMEAILIDRTGEADCPDERAIESLRELLARIEK